MRKLIFMLAFLLMAGMHVVYAQTTISGTVTDDKGEPVPGANVRAKGYSDVGTITDLDGNYSLNVPEEATTLVYSFVGMATKEVEIAGQTSINVAFEAEDVGLEEVVVTALGIERDKKALGYSVGTVDSENLNQKPEVDIASSLAGKVAGVDIVKNSGAIGAGSKITIRGASSINTSNMPLFIVDGIPFDASTNSIGDFSSGGGNTGMDPSRFLDIDPNNIESVSVLKGLSAATLYGEAGRNGVILIETKTGAQKKAKGLKVSVNQSFYMNQVAKLPDYQNKYGQGGDNVANVGFVGNWGAPFSDNLTVAHHYNTAAWETVFPEYQGVEVPYQAYENNVRDFFRNGFGTNTYVNVQSGFENGSVSFNAGYTDEDGYIPENNIKKFNAGLGANFTVDKFRFSTNLNFANTNYLTPPLAANNAANAVTIFQRLLFIPRNLDLQNLPYSNPADHSSVYYRNDQENPYWLLDNSSQNNTTDRFYGNFKASYDILDKLNISYQLGLDTYHDRNRYHINKGGNSSVYATNGYFREVNSTNTIWNQDILLNLANTKLTENIDISATVGTQIRYTKYNRSGIASSNQIVYGVVQHDNFSAGANIDPLTGVALDYESEQTLVGFFAEATLDYNDFVYLTLSGRNDWSSTVEKANRAKFYPSAALSFVPTSAFEALQNDYINFMKIRFAYGTSAGFPGPYNTRETYVLTPQVFDAGNGPLPSIAASTFLGNPNLRPELHTEYEIGFEGNFLYNRLSVEGTYYNKVSKDQITLRRLDAASGYTSTYVNLGEVDTWGVEFNLGITPIKTEVFKWTINNIFSMNRSEVVDTGGDKIMFNGYSNLGNFAIEGEPLGVIVGDYAPRDENGNLLINPNDGHIFSSNDLGLDVDIIGDPNPDFKYNVINTFSYKGFTLTAQVDYTHGGDFYSNSIVSMLRRGVTKDTEEREGTYVIPGVLANPTTGEVLIDENGNPIKNTIQLGMNDIHFLNMNDPSGQGIYDATVIRLREVALTYTLPQSVMSKIPLGTLSFTLSGQNVWYYAPNVPKYTNFDPETLSTGAGNGLGLEFGSPPSSRKFGFSIKATF